jgi:hypothetical protein
MKTGLSQHDHMLKLTESLKLESQIQIVCDGTLV